MYAFRPKVGTAITVECQGRTAQGIFDIDERGRLVLRLHDPHRIITHERPKPLTATPKSA